VLEGAEVEAWLSRSRARTLHTAEGFRTGWQHGRSMVGEGQSFGGRGGPINSWS
jgi:hypothetical protein